jgi:integrase
LVYLAGLAAGSRPAMRGALDVIADIATGGALDADALPWAALRYEHTQAIRAALAERYAARTANKMLSALRGVLKAAWRLGQMDSDAYHRAADVDALAVSTPSQAERGQHATAGELSALVGACVTSGTKAGIRDAAILALAYACGLRRAELASLSMADFDRERSTLTVKGKRNKTRVVPLENDGAMGALLDWLHLRGNDPGPVFLRVRRGDHITADGLTPHAIYGIIAERCEQAAVKELRPHDMRRTFAGDLLDRGVDIATVQQLMGHASPTTTAGYDRRPGETKRRAVAKLHFPYHRVYGA